MYYYLERLNCPDIFTKFSKPSIRAHVYRSNVIQFILIHKNQISREAGKCDRPITNKQRPR